ncbi:MULTISPECIES: MarR family winged helix-turn-helix transcriptional regulator [unclassified Microbacterium]|uniref:MarR family winged helix-turn-helix transcriptional regulator n=1 Tax=unclassified Microbacterium TaxID=2609290 RepID=UPI00386D74E3
MGPSTELVKRVLHLSGQLEAIMRSELAALDLTPAEFDILAALRRQGAPFAMRPRDLAHSLMLSSGGTTNVVHRLVTRGLASREADPDDARGKILRLTADGVALAERAVLANVEAQEALFAKVPASTVGAATAALRAVGEELT